MHRTWIHSSSHHPESVFHSLAGNHMQPTGIMAVWFNITCELNTFLDFKVGAIHALATYLNWCIICDGSSKRG